MSRPPRLPCLTVWGCRVRRFLPVLLLSLILPGRAADLLDGAVTGFSFADVDERTGQRRSLLRGQRMVTLPTQMREIRGVQLELYDDAGATNLLMTTDLCYFDLDGRRVFSPAALQARTGDETLRLEGVGFGWSQGSATLTVSNQVHALMLKAAVAGPAPGPSAPADPVAPRAAGPAADRLEVRSQSLEFAQESAAFRGQVRAEDSEGTMQCDELRVRLSGSTRRVQEVLALGRVQIASTDLRAEAPTALYRAPDDAFVFEEGVVWSARGREGQADRMRLERRNQRLEAEGNVSLELPATELIPGGVWSPETEPAAPAAEDRLVKVFAQSLQSRPEERGTNYQLTTLTGDVRIEDGENRMHCGRFEATTLEPEHRAWSAVAEDGVTLERASGRLVAQEAHYTADPDRIEFRGRPQWREQGREGESDTLRIDLARGRYDAVGDVRIRFPAESMGTTLPWLPAAGEGTPSVTNVPPVELRCAEFTADDPPDREGAREAVARGEVMVRQGDRFEMTCRQLAASIAGATNRLERLVAQESVEIRVIEPGGYRLARGDRADYDAVRGLLELTGADGVEFLIVDAEGVSRGLGQRATYLGDLQTLELEGYPQITTPRGDLWGDRVRFDRRTGTVSASGRWEIRIPMRDLRLPELPDLTKP